MMRKLLIALAMASASHATIGHAQSAAGDEASTSDSGEIVVTAQKREERLQDVPMSITALGGEQMVRSGITSTVIAASAASPR